LQYFQDNPGTGGGRGQTLPPIFLLLQARHLRHPSAILMLDARIWKLCSLNSIGFPSIPLKNTDGWGTEVSSNIEKPADARGLHG
jgi:hypothetical protein